MAEREIKILAKIIRQRGEVNSSRSDIPSLRNFVDPVPIGMRKRSKKRGPLSLHEKISIVHQVLVQF